MNINKIAEILQKPEIQFGCLIENIESIEFEKGFEEDTITVTFNEKLKFNHYINYKTEEMMKIEYKKAKSKQKHQAICIQTNFEVKV